jgi:hypothetical protein
MMSDTYTMDETAAPPVDPTPDDPPGKISQEDANYRDGNLTFHCGLCSNFEGAANGTCTKVEGDINPYMLSDEYDGVKNPLLHKTPPALRPRPGGYVPSGGAANAAPDQPPVLRIGRKAY